MCTEIIREGGNLKITVGFFESHIFSKIIKSTKFVNIWRKLAFYSSIKQLITLEIVINSLSGRVFKNVIVESQVFCQRCDIFKKNSCSLITQIYAMQDGGISLIKRFFGYAG